MIQEQIISFVVAKLAKEKGFDCECENYYDVPRYTIYNNDTKEFLHRKYNNCKGYDSYYTTNQYKAPTQSLLQKYLREVHKIDIAIIYFDKGFLYSVKDRFTKANSYKVEYIDTYEEALEIGLQEALSRIIN